ncbi:MAG: protein kinase [Ideonella sp.]|nr:protein kinase [Ideonella sp.]
MSFDVEIGIASARGPKATNEDFAGAATAPRGEEERGLVAAIADGVSAGGLGLEAAQTTVLALLGDFFATPETWEATVVLDRLIGAQNAWLADHNRRRQGPGHPSGAALTTLTALAIQGQTYTLAHVGDTRAWRLRAAAGATPALELLTTDHALDHLDFGSRLTRAVGLDAQVHADYTQGEVQVGDCFVLTSDGVHGLLGPARLAALSATGTAPAAAAALVAAAAAAGAHDDATALVVRVQGLDDRQLHDELGATRRLDPPPLLRLGASIDGYQVTALVARSGPHLLYQARELATERLVAIKTLHPAHAADPEERAMLAHEAWLAARVAASGAPGFVRVHERRADASALYTVFDWHGGQTLAQLLQTEPRAPVAQLVAAARELATALGRLHRLGVVHRDIKPANLHRGDDGRWRILDLGVAISGRESQAQRELHAGTPSYINPEQWEGAQADAASDLFALGVTLYQWATGRLPYGDIVPYQSGRYRRDPRPPSRIRPDVPIWLDHLLAKAVARDPRLRFETAEELLLALDRGASRTVNAPAPTPLLRRDPAALVKLALAVSLLLNLLLAVWLLFLPR